MKNRDMKWRTGKALTVGLCMCMILGVPVQSLAEMDGARGAEQLFDLTGETALATGSDAGMLSVLPDSAATKGALSEDFWNGWTGDMSFLDGSHGNGTEKKPYQISTREQLMGLSALAAGDMEVKEGEGTYPGSYSGAYFELTRNIDLGGMNWIPIGFYKNEADMYAGKAAPFDGHFNGNGKTISNFRLYEPAWIKAGLFGALEDAEIIDLTVKPGNVITAKEYAGILAGSAENSVIRDVTVMGTVKASGTAGGVFGELLEGTVVENCLADHVAVDAGPGKEIFVGGIAGKAAGSVIVDCVVNTGDSLSARIQGGGYVGGITGFQNDTDIFNAHVMGTIGGTGSQAIGGVTGKYASGKLKVARFEGKIASSGLGSAAREGTFIGTHDTGFLFRYGTKEGADLAYLFADSEAKIAAGVCGSGISDDNRFSYDAHIGFWHGGDNYFTLVQGQNTRAEEEMYFYEELENGMLHVIDSEDTVRDMACMPDHFAPGALGRPARGYLVSVLQIDTAANVQNYYDVASLTAHGESAYSHELDKSHRGAVAAGDTVTVVTAPRNTEEEKYQMDGTPTYTDEWGKRKGMAYQTGGAYSFVMPEHDTEVSAVYRKVAANVQTVPEEYGFKVVQERTGDRKAPSVTTEVRDMSGKLIARYLNGELEAGTKVQDVKIQSVVDRQNDVTDEAVKWSVDDDELIILKRNPDEDNLGYTKQSASIELNLNAGFFRDIQEKAEKEQAKNGYQYPIPDTVYGNGTLGGLAVLTAKTRPSESFEGKPLSANCRIPVTFQIKDRTNVAAEGALLDKTALSFTVTRTLSGNRKNPKEVWNVTAPQTLKASFSPDYFDKKHVKWSVDDENIVRVNAGGFGNGAAEGDYKNAGVSAVKETKWIQDIVDSDDTAYKEDVYRKRQGTGEREAVVTVTADDTLGNKQTASCEVRVNFVTVDETEVLPEAVVLNKEELKFRLVHEKEGGPHSKTIKKHGFEPEQLSAKILPELSDEDIYTPLDRGIIWESSDPAVVVKDGVVSPVDNAEWMGKTAEKAPYHGEKTATITARAAGNREVLAQCEVILAFDVMCLDVEKKDLEFDMTLTKTGPQRNPVLTWDGAEGQNIPVNVYPKAEDGKEAAVLWETDPFILCAAENGMLAPVTDAEWITQAMKKYPYTAEKTANVLVKSGAQTETVQVRMKFKMMDKTYSSSGSGGSTSGSGSSGNGSSSGITVTGTTKTAVEAPKGSVTGVWVQDGAGYWLFTSGGRTYADEWAYIHNPYAGDGQESTSWFRFDKDGHMQTGWYREERDGCWYYLHGQMDGSLGHMYTGWHEIGGKWYFFDRSGRMMTGWNWIDGACYYMDEQNGHMLSDCKTPDGYTVNASGAWTENGIVQTIGTGK